MLFRGLYLHSILYIWIWGFKDRWYNRGLENYAEFKFRFYHSFQICNTEQVHLTSLRSDIRKRGLILLSTTESYEN